MERRLWGADKSDALAIVSRRIRQAAAVRRATCEIDGAPDGTLCTAVSGDGQ
jgi:hypothetical protein